MGHGWAPRQASVIPVVTWWGGRRADGVLTTHGPDHSLSSGFWGSNIFTWVKGNKPLRPFTSPSHWPLMFILVTFTMSPTYKKKTTKKQDELEKHKKYRSCKAFIIVKKLREKYYWFLKQCCESSVIIKPYSIKFRESLWKRLCPAHQKSDPRNNIFFKDMECID